MVANGGHVSKRDRAFRIGFQVVEVPCGHHGRLWTLAGAKVVHDSGLSGARELTVSLQLAEGAAYVVAPYCGAPGVEGPFVLRTFSSVAIEMTQARSSSLLIHTVWWN
jgi:Calpain large subunit, domain III